jgi:hypothetical protein
MVVSDIGPAPPGWHLSRDVGLYDRVALAVALNEASQKYAQPGQSEPLPIKPVHHPIEPGEGGVALAEGEYAEPRWMLRSDGMGELGSGGAAEGAVGLVNVLVVEDALG